MTMAGQQQTHKQQHQNHDLQEALLRLPSSIRRIPMLKGKTSSGAMLIRYYVFLAISLLVIVGSPSSTFFLLPVVQGFSGGAGGCSGIRGSVGPLHLDPPGDATLNIVSETDLASRGLTVGYGASDTIDFTPFETTTSGGTPTTLSTEVSYNLYLQPDIDSSVSAQNFKGFLFRLADASTGAGTTVNPIDTSAMLDVAPGSNSYSQIALVCTTNSPPIGGVTHTSNDEKQSAIARLDVTTPGMYSLIVTAVFDNGRDPNDPSLIWESSWAYTQYMLQVTGPDTGGGGGGNGNGNGIGIGNGGSGNGFTDGTGNGDETFGDGGGFVPSPSLGPTTPQFGFPEPTVFPEPVTTPQFPVPQPTLSPGMNFPQPTMPPVDFNEPEPISNVDIGDLIPTTPPPGSTGGGGGGGGVPTPSPGSGGGGIPVPEPEGMTGGGGGGSVAPEPTSMLPGSTMPPIEYVPGSGCSVCPEGSVMGNTEQTVPGFLTCGDIQNAIAVQPDLLCPELIGLQRMLAVDALCGCSGVTPPDITCFLCPTADDLLIDEFYFDPDTQIQESCAGASMVASYMIDPGTCTSTISTIAPFCCASGGLPPPGDDGDEMTNTTDTGSLNPENGSLPEGGTTSPSGGEAEGEGGDDGGETPGSGGSEGETTDEGSSGYMYGVSFETILVLLTCVALSSFVL